jgi:hypothetical protein
VAGSNAIWLTLLILAEVAAPPSPEYPAMPVPITVVMIWLVEGEREVGVCEGVPGGVPDGVIEGVGLMVAVRVRVRDDDKVGEGEEVWLALG